VTKINKYIALALSCNFLLYAVFWNVFSPEIRNEWVSECVNLYSALSLRSSAPGAPPFIHIRFS